MTERRTNSSGRATEIDRGSSVAVTHCESCGYLHPMVDQSGRFWWGNCLLVEGISLTDFLIALREQGYVPNTDGRYWTALCPGCGEPFSFEHTQALQSKHEDGRLRERRSHRGTKEERSPEPPAPRMRRTIPPPGREANARKRRRQGVQS
jgi:hypothetical protein